MRFKIITATRNSELWIERCLESIKAQVWPGGMDVYVIDDASTDKTPELVKEFCEREGWGYRLNTERLHATHNQVDGIRAMYTGDPMDVIVFVDGDDYLPHDQVLKILDYHYADGTLLTYGSYRSEPFSPTCQMTKPYPEEVIDHGTFRRFVAAGRGINHNHLRTFRYKLFNALQDSDFLNDEGEWFATSTDHVMMFPCMELAGKKLKCLRDVLLVYNSENTESEWRTRPRLIDSDTDCILRRQPKKPLP